MRILELVAFSAATIVASVLVVATMTVA